MNNSKNKIISHTTIYMFGDILRHSVSLLMLPIYTRYLTPADYGTVELLSMLIDFASIIFGARIAQAIFRFYCSAHSEYEKNNIIASSLSLGALLNGIGVITIIAFSDSLSLVIFSDPSYSTLIALFSITMFLVPLVEIPLIHIRAQQKPHLFLKFSILKLIIQVSLNLYLVVFLEMHVEGVIYSAVISSIVMTSILITYTLSNISFQPTIKMCKKLFSFSLPIKIATIGSFYLTFGDRYILNIYTDLTQVGIYSLGYKFGFIFTVLAWAPFEKMWDSEKYNIQKKQNANYTYQKTFLYINSFMISLGLFISLFTKDLLTIMSDPAFITAYTIVPIIIFAYIIQAWTKYCDLGILLENQTKQIAYAEIIAVVVITLAYFTLIPSYGMFGAAWATVIGFSARFIWIHRKGKQAYDMNLPWKKVAVMAALAILIFFSSIFIPDDLILSIILRAALMALFIILILTLPIFSKAERKEIYEHLDELKQTLTLIKKNK